MSGHVLDEAVFLGVISRSDYDDLRNMMKYRDAIVHGFSPSDFGHHMVAELIGRVKIICEEAASPTD
jgi:DNA-binding MltR family transcriptional regulator